EHAILRYANWATVRSRVLGHLGVIMCASLLGNYITILHAMHLFDTVSQEGRPNCGCHVAKTYKTMQSQLEKIDPDGYLVFWKIAASIVIGLASPVLERFIGRRRCLLLFLSLNVVWSGLISTHTQYLTTLSLFGICGMSSSLSPPSSL
ncbi:hypothetical protein PENTCL1PPCAC_5773, partial [Pristionchus entomophagus]